MDKSFCNTAQFERKATESERGWLNRAALKKILPHREPFLFLDEAMIVEPGKRAVGRWHLTGEEYFFKGHFPGNPVLPGVLMLESIAQLGALVVLSLKEMRGKIALFGGAEDVRYKRIVKPGDTLEISADIERLVLGRLGKGIAQASVNGELAVRARLTFALQEGPGHV